MGIYDFLQQNQLTKPFMSGGSLNTSLMDQYDAGFTTTKGEYALRSKANPNVYTFLSQDTTDLEFNPWAFYSQKNAVTKALEAPIEDYIALANTLKLSVAEIAITPPPALSNYADMEMPTAPINLGLGNTPGDMAIKAAQDELNNSTYFKGL